MPKVAGTPSAMAISQLIPARKSLPLPPSQSREATASERGRHRANAGRGAINSRAHPTNKHKPRTHSVFRILSSRKS
jgi:hypothetical protein